MAQGLAAPATCTLAFLLAMAPAKDLAAAATVDAVVGQPPSQLTQGQSLAPGTGLSTGSSRVQLGLGGDNLLRLGSDTQGALDQGGGLQLQSGVALVNAERGMFKKVSVETPEHKITARGLLLIAYSPGEFLKVTCLSGTARVDLQAKFREFVDLAEGDILITTPTDETLPDTAKVDIAYQSQTSALIADSGFPPLPGDALANAIARQEKAFARGQQQTTPLILGTDNSLRLDAVEIANMQARQRAQEELEKPARIAEVRRPGGGGGGGSQPDPSSFPPLPPGFEETRLRNSESNFRDVANTSQDQIGQVPPSMRDPNRLVLQSPESQVLNPAGTYDVTRLAREFAAIGSALDLTIVSRVVTSGKVSYLELFAGRDLTVTPSGLVDVGALEQWEAVFDDGDFNVNEFSESYQNEAGLRLFAQRDLNVAGQIRNRLGPVALEALRRVTLDGATISGISASSQTPVIAPQSYYHGGGSSPIFVAAPEVRIAATRFDAAMTSIEGNVIRGNPERPTNRANGTVSMTHYDQGNPARLEGVQLQTGGTPHPQASYNDIQIFGNGLVINSSRLRVLANSLPFSDIALNSSAGISIQDSMLENNSSGGVFIFSNGGAIAILNSEIVGKEALQVSQWGHSGGAITVSNSTFRSNQIVQLQNYSSQGIRFSGNTNFFSPLTRLLAPTVRVDSGVTVRASGAIDLQTDNFNNQGQMFQNNDQPVTQPNGPFP